MSQTNLVIRTLFWTLLLGLAGRAGLFAGPAEDADFQARCQGSDVVLCVGFDNDQTDIQPYLNPVWNTSIYRGSFDSSQAASGAGSLRFEIPPFSREDSSGNWHRFLGDYFGQGEKFYVQFRQRFSPEMLTANFGGDGWKQFILFMHGGPTCANVELTAINGYQRNYPTMYTDCGNRGFQLNIQGDYLNQWSSDWPSNPHPNEWVECHFNNQQAPPNGGCLMYRENDWMTFYVEVELGNWGQPNSKIRTYVGYEGGPLYQIVHLENYTLYSNSSSSDHYSAILLTPFNTNKPDDRNHPTAYTWYDELIVSKSPIPAPGSASPTNQAPTVDAGSNQTITLPSSASLDGTVSDDGLPNPPGTVTTTWSKVSGPGAVTFGNAASVDTTVNFSTAGTYILRLTANDSALSTNDTVTHTVHPAPADPPEPNEAPVVNAGADQTITLPSPVQLEGTATDDGRPTDQLSFLWRALDAPGDVQFIDPTNLKTFVHFDTSGLYRLSLQANDGDLISLDDVLITVQSQPAKQQEQDAPSKNISVNGDPIRLVYQIERDGHVVVDVYDRRGQQVAKLDKGSRASGRHEMVWDLRNTNGAISSGVYYFYFNLDGRQIDVKKAVVIR